MATSKVCDLCGSPAIGEVVVVLHSMSTVVADKPTATTSHALDVCGDCREKGFLLLFEGALVQHERSIPIHRALIAERSDEAKLREDMKAAVSGRDRPGASPADRANADNEIARLEQALAENLTRQQTILNQAKEL